MTSDVLTRIEGALGHITLNRLQALHALTEPMCAKDNAPRWMPGTLGAVSETMLDAIFARLPDAEEWTPL
ncbi:MAG: hypothetical protein NW206_20645 [Hyphomonadaceae bacterium]|nr:hypothetical protein [Hyphomonadaceae bacterium]